MSSHKYKVVIRGERRPLDIGQFVLLLVAMAEERLAAKEQQAKAAAPSKNENPKPEAA